MRLFVNISMISCTVIVVSTTRAQMGQTGPIDPNALSNAHDYKECARVKILFLVLCLSYEFFKNIFF
jgi:hypothetical protein